MRREQSLYHIRICWLSKLKRRRIGWPIAPGATDAKNRGPRLSPRGPPYASAQQEARRCCRRERAAKHSQERVEPGFVCGRRRLRGCKVNLINCTRVGDLNAVLSNKLKRRIGLFASSGFSIGRRERVGGGGIS